MGEHSFDYKNKSYTFIDQIPGRVIETIKHKQRFYEQRMLERIKNLDIKGVYIDVGANIGNHSVYFADQCSATKVIAIEPIPDIYKTLQTNIKKNKLTSKIKAFNLAASDAKGTVRIDYRPKKRGGIAMVNKNSKGPKIETDTLDNLAGTDKISLIKIDVEGFESYVLKGALKVIKRDSPILFIEAKLAVEKKSIDKILNKINYYAYEVFNASATYMYVSKTDKRIKHSYINEAKLSLKKFRVLRRA